MTALNTKFKYGDRVRTRDGGTGIVKSKFHGLISSEHNYLIVIDCEKKVYRESWLTKIL